MKKIYILGTSLFAAFAAAAWTAMLLADAGWFRAWVCGVAGALASVAALFLQGRPVCDGVSGRLRYELRATWLGGTRILDRLDRSGCDVFSARPKLGAADALVIAFGTLLWRETRPSPIRS